MAFIPAKPFQFLELSLDVCTGLSHKARVNHSLILSCLSQTGSMSGTLHTVFHRNPWGVSSTFWIIVAILDILVGFLAPT